MRINMDDWNENKIRQWHLKLLKECKDENKAIRIIKKNIPRGYTLKSYLEELSRKLVAENWRDRR